jgi:hypothetical protein
LLWQTDTITEAHEHFLTTLIRQKILVNTEKAQSRKVNASKKTFVLYLPDNEIHELGLMFINHEIVHRGYQSIFLGQSVPLNSLTALFNYYEDITFISYFTVKPEKGMIDQYIEDFNKTILSRPKTEFWILGQMLNALDLKRLPPKIKPFKSIESLIKEL